MVETKYFEVESGVAVGDSILIKDDSGKATFSDIEITSPKTLKKLITAIENTFDNSTNGFIATNVQAAIEEVSAGALTIGFYNLSSSTAFSTSTRYTSFALITGFTLTPRSGQYAVLYNASVYYTTTPKAHYWQFYKAGSAVSTSLRSQDTAHSNQNMVDSSIDIISVNGSQAIDVRVACDNTGTLTVNQRSLVLIRLGDAV